MLAKLTRHLVSHWLLDIGFACVFLAIVLRGDRRKSDRFTILRGPFLVVAKARGFLLAKPYYEPIQTKAVYPQVVEHRKMSATERDVHTRRMERHDRLARSVIRDLLSLS